MTLKTSHRALASLALAMLASTALAAEPSRVITIPAGSLADALRTLADQTHQQLLYSSDLVKGRRVNALTGRYTPEEALRRLLAGSGVEAERAGPSVIILRQSSPLVHTATPYEGEPAGQDQSNSTSTTLAPAPAVATAAPPAPVQDVVVTGTHIRGVEAIASPLVSVTADDIVREGDATVADALDRLPENFNGQATPNSVLVGSDRAETNIGVSQGVNLRGLGAGATLVLLNGRRLAGSGLLGDFVDVSSIPTAAVDHVEVLLDGASAIYGSDAVGGVVNIITKHDFNGADTTLRYGVDEGGVGASTQVSQTFGAAWDGGHALLTYEYQHDDRLSANARRYTANSDLTSLGGTDHDVLYSAPGNILTLNAAGTAYNALYAIPGGSGLGLTPSDFIPGSANELNSRRDTDVEPRQDRNGLFADVEQDLGARTHLDIQGRYDLRVFDSNGSAPETVFEVTPANPYYVSPNGAASELIGYSTALTTGQARQSGTDKSYDVSIGLTQEVGKTWRVEGYGGYAEEIGRTFDSGVINSTHLNQALGNTPSDPATGFSTAVDGFFNPYGDGRSNAKTILNFITDGYARYVDDSRVATAGLQADGTLFDGPGGPVKLAIGAQYRHERFEPTFSALVSSAPVVQGGTAYGRAVSAGYAEINAPLVGASNALPGIERLTLSLAGRVEHYDDVGTTADPKIGLLWKPVADLSVRATYGTSFRAPSLSEVGQPSTIEPEIIPKGATRVLTLFELGGNPDLKPQTASTWTAGVDWRPSWARGVEVTATWFDVDFKNQISEPAVANTATVLSDPAFASLVTLINPSDPADLAKVNALLAATTSTTAKLFPASAYGAIVDGRYVNTSALHVSGVDFDIQYRFAWRGDQFGLTANGTYLLTYAEKATPGSPTEELVSTAGQPVDFRGRLIGDWTHGAWRTSATVNYVNSYEDPTADRPISAWTTVDLSVTWTSPIKSGPMSGLTVTAAAQNLFDQDPPFYDSYLGIGYDPANANPFGRILSIRLDKRW